MSVATDFWDLPASSRRAIVKTLGGLSDLEMRMPEHHRNVTAFRRIAEKNLRWRLVEMIEKANRDNGR